MALWTRRDIMRLGLAASALGICPAVRANPKPVWPTNGKKTPRYFVFVHLYGGLDGILSTDPRTRDSINPEVDLPYSETDISNQGNLRLGPSLAPLARHASEL